MGRAQYYICTSEQRRLLLIILLLIVTVAVQGLIPAQPSVSRRKNALSATLEKPFRHGSASFDDEDEDDDDEDEDDEDNPLTRLNIPITPLNGSFDRPSQHKSTSATRRLRNKAMQDPQFLRKRTADLLKVTEDSNASSAPEQIGKHMKVDKKTFHFLLDAWAFSGEPDAPDHALQLLERMEKLSPQLVQPDVRSYTKTINAIARSSTATAGDQAEKVLARLKTVYQQALQSKPDEAAALKPNSYTYTAVVKAHAYSGEPGSAERAEQLTEKMVDKYQRGDNEVKPTAKAFNSVIHAYGKEGRAEAAERVFHRMEQLYRSGIREAKPNAFNYNALISAWANCEEEGSVERAKEVLERMERLYQAGDGDVKPTVVSFNAVIDAYAKAGQAQKAEELLRRMGEENLPSPNTRSFNSVINAWAKSGEDDAAMHAEELLDLMEKRYEEGNIVVRPDVHSFCTVINGENTLQYLILDHLARPHSCLSPFFSYTAYARSSKNDKAERAFNLYQEMKNNKHVQPNVIAVNAVMNACAYTNGDIRHRNRAVELAHKILKDLEQSPYGSPDQVTYGTFLKVCAQQMPDSHTRQQIVEVLFKKCCRDGQVGNLVLQQFQSMASPDLFQDVLGRSIHDDVRIEDLPENWRCNVVEGKRRRRRNLHQDL